MELSRTHTVRPGRQLINTTESREPILTVDRESQFRQLYEDHVGRVGRYIARRIPANDVQDVLAETLLTTWRKLDEIPEDAVPWLFKTASNHIANRLRTSRRKQALGNKLATSSARFDPRHSSNDLNEVDQQLIDAIRGLPDAEREAFMLVAWDGLDAKRGAQALGCSPAAFRVRLHRARRRLKRRVTAYAPVAATPSDIRIPMEDWS